MIANTYPACCVSRVCPRFLLISFFACGAAQHEAEVCRRLYEALSGGGQLRPRRGVQQRERRRLRAACRAPRQTALVMVTQRGRVYTTKLNSIVGILVGAITVR